MTTKAKIEQILHKHFKIARLEIVDDSLKHAGHAEAKRLGGGHFEVRIVSDDFKGKKPLERHRMIYKVLEGELKGEIHALAIKALAPGEDA